eukprot:1140896-Pelagomonas_calceolata.AAC.4
MQHSIVLNSQRWTNSPPGTDVFNMLITQGAPIMGQSNWGHPAESAAGEPYFLTISIPGYPLHQNA